VKGRGTIVAWRLVILVALLGSWEWLTGIKAVSRMPGLYWIDPFFVSRPSEILKRFVFLASDEVRLTIWQMALSTIQSTLWGFVVGVSSGFAAGLLLGRNDRLARIFEPYIIAFNSLPRIALVPLITMIFGFGLLAKIVLAWTIVFFIVFFNTFQGARSVDADLINAARFLGASERQVLRTIVVPSALAWTFASLTPSISFALIGVVVGEFLGGESGGGLGYLIIQSLGTLSAADMMVALLSLGVIGVVMALGIKQIEARLLDFQLPLSGDGSQVQIEFLLLGQRPLLTEDMDARLVEREKPLDPCLAALDASSRLIRGHPDEAQLRLVRAGDRGLELGGEAPHRDAALLLFKCGEAGPRARRERRDVPVEALADQVHLGRQGMPRLRRAEILLGLDPQQPFFLGGLIRELLIDRRDEPEILALIPQHLRPTQLDTA